jgi:hypothetical protein
MVNKREAPPRLLVDPAVDRVRIAPRNDRSRSNPAAVAGSRVDRRAGPSRAAMTGSRAGGFARRGRVTGSRGGRVAGSRGGESRDRAAAGSRDRAAADRGIARRNGSRARAAADRGVARRRIAGSRGETVRGLARRLAGSRDRAARGSR